MYIFCYFGGILLSHRGIYMKFSLISIYDSISLRKRSHINGSVLLTRVDHLFNNQLY